MSPLTEPTKLVLRRELPADAEADAYIAAVEAADGQALEPGVKFAIKNFVLCCKQDGIWTAIKAGCILAGARTLSGALQPLVGTAPTNVNFVSGDYNRKTGLGSNINTSKFLQTSRAANADPQDNTHLSVFLTTSPTYTQFILGSGGINNGATDLIYDGSTGYAARSRRDTAGSTGSRSNALGFIGQARSNGSNAVLRHSNVNFALSSQSQTPTSSAYNVFNTNPTFGGFYCNSKIAFYSIGESLDLTKLDARVTDLINAFGAAIP